LGAGQRRLFESDDVFFSFNLCGRLSINQLIMSRHSKRATALAKLTDQGVKYDALGCLTTLGALSKLSVT